MLAFLEAQRGSWAQSTVVRRFASIRFYHNFLISTRARVDDPTSAIRLKQPKDPPKQPFTRDELRTLLAVCRRFQERAILLLLIDTGLRLSEIVGIRRNQIDFGQGLIRVYGKGRKYRLVAPSKATLDALALCLKDAAGHDREFPWYSQRIHGPMTRDGFYRLIKRLGKRAGLSKVHPHRFRTSWACMFLEETGGDVGSAQVLMGHEKVETTLHYAAAIRERRALDVQRRHSLAERLDLGATG